MFNGGVCLGSFKLVLTFKSYISKLLLYHGQRCCQHTIAALNNFLLVQSLCCGLRINVIGSDDLSLFLLLLLIWRLKSVTVLAPTYIYIQWHRVMCQHEPLSLKEFNLLTRAIDDTLLSFYSSLGLSSLTEALQQVNNFGLTNAIGKNITFPGRKGVTHNHQNA